MSEPVPVLLQVLRTPSALATLDLSGWNDLVHQARITHLLGRVNCQVQDLGLADRVPEPVRPHLAAVRTLVERQYRCVRWEIHKVLQALRGVDTPVVLLKGAAYVAAGLPVARGRTFVDTDILVVPEKLAEVEAALQAQGWEIALDHPLDELYFRKWLHELPPMQHRARRTNLDVHRNVLPFTDTLRVNARLLLEAATPVPEVGAAVLRPADMVLHNAAHLFRNGDFDKGLRDLGDLDGLLRTFSSRPAFWDEVLNRATQLGLGRPLFCGLRYARHFYETPVPDDVQRHAARWSYGRFALRLLDRLVRRAVLPRYFDEEDPGRNRAIKLLSHWPLPRPQVMATGLFWLKRLPPWLLGYRTPEVKPQG